MAVDSKISALTNYTTPLSADVLPIVDTANTTTKKVTWANILTTAFTSPTLVTPTLGVATATSVNKVALTAPATGSTLTIADGKTLTANNNITIAGTDGKTLSVSNSLTLAGTDSTTMTFPSTSATIARTDAANTFTGTQTVSTIQAPTNASVNINSGSYNTLQTYAPGAGGTANVDLSKGNIVHITMPAGNITISLSNGTAGQCFIIRILQDSTGSRTVSWFTTIRWAGGSAPTLTTGANKVDTVGFEITGSNTYDGFVIGQNI